MTISDLPELARRIRRALDWHRRLVAALLTGVAVVAALTSLAPAHVATRGVWTAARDLAGGAPLRAADLILRQVPVPLVPAGALTGASTVVGRLLAAPVRRGEPLTDVRLLEPSLLAALARPGQVAVPVRVADGAAAVALVHPGDVVDVLAAGALDADPAGADSAAEPLVVASGATVLSVPGRDAATGADAGLVVVAVSPVQAASLASAATRHTLSLVLRRS
jgi:Flp pilus assembly protein CpaB